MGPLGREIPPEGRADGRSEDSGHVSARSTQTEEMKTLEERAPTQESLRESLPAREERARGEAQMEEEEAEGEEKEEEEEEEQVAVYRPRASRIRRTRRLEIHPILNSLVTSATELSH